VAHFRPLKVAQFHPLAYAHFNPLRVVHFIRFLQLCHATGNAKRLNRFKSNETNPFNSKSSYTKEELVAEIGAAFLNSHAGILNNVTLQDSAAYIQGWLKQLRNDKKFIIEASAKAQKAVDYILNKGS
jgi:antirestriction protein ArdC